MTTSLRSFRTTTTFSQGVSWTEDFVAPDEVRSVYHTKTGDLATIMLGGVFYGEFRCSDGTDGFIAGTRATTPRVFGYGRGLLLVLRRATGVHLVGRGRDGATYAFAVPRELVPRASHIESEGGTARVQNGLVRDVTFVARFRDHKKMRTSSSRYIFSRYNRVGPITAPPNDRIMSNSGVLSCLSWGVGAGSPS